MPELENNYKQAIRYAVYENGVSHVKGDEIEIGKKFAESLEMKRSRICFHRNSNDDNFPQRHLCKTP
jgi:hypothetical protein